MKNLVRALRHPADYPWLELRPIQRHSVVLIVGGLIYVAIGAVYAFTESSPQRIAGLKLALVAMPVQGWGVAWMVVGLLAVLSARWPPASKTWGYTALTGMAVCWAGMFLGGVAFLDTPSSGLTATLVYGLLGFMWWAIAGLMNPDDLLALVTETASCGTGSDDSEDT